jgi:hypothetical protein
MEELPHCIVALVLCVGYSALAVECSERSIAKTMTSTAKPAWRGF